DCESSEKDAFQLSDERALGAVVGEAQKTIALWFEMRLNQTLLESIDQGVVVVDEGNHITRLNRQAAELLGGVVDAATLEAFGGGAQPDESKRRQIIKGKELTQFAAEDEARIVLAAGRSDSKKVQLRGADNQERTALVRSYDTEAPFNRRVWVLT